MVYMYICIYIYIYTHVSLKLFKCVITKLLICFHFLGIQCLVRCQFDAISNMGATWWNLDFLPLDANPIVPRSRSPQFSFL